MINKQKSETRSLTITTILLALSTNLFAGIKIEKNVSYGPHPMDVYWDTDYKNAPIVFIIHGVGKNPDLRKQAYPQIL